MKANINIEDDKKQLTLIPEDNFEISLLEEITDNKQSLSFELKEIKRFCDLKVKNELFLKNKHLIVTLGK